MYVGILTPACIGDAFWFAERPWEIINSHVGDRTAFRCWTWWLQYELPEEYANQSGRKIHCLSKSHISQLLGVYYAQYLGMVLYIKSIVPSSVPWQLGL